MKLYNLLSLRTLKARPMRSILSMLSIMIGVAGILALSISNEAAMASITALFEQSSGRSDLMITAASGDNGFSSNILRVVSNIAGVRSISPIVKVNTAFPDQQNEEALQVSFFNTAQAGLLLFGIQPDLDLIIRDYKITEGRFLNPDSDNLEIILVENLANDNEIQVGDRVKLLSPNGLETFKVVGLIAREGVGQTNNGNFGVIHLLTAQKVFNRKDVFDQLDIMLQDHIEGNRVEEKRLEIQKRIGTDHAVTYPAGQGQRMSQMLSNYQIGLNFLSAIALFVGAFLIYNAFTMTVVERTYEYGMLRTIGMSKRQVTSTVLFDSVLLGLVGSLLGVAVGILGARGLASLMGNLLGTDLVGTMSVPIGSLFMSLVIGMGVTVVSALLPAIKAGKISPIAALRIRGLKKEGFFSKWGGLIGAALLLISTVLLIWNPIPDDPLFRVGSMTVFLMFTGVTLIIPATLQWWQKATQTIMKKVYGNSGLIGNRNLERSKSRTTLTVTALLVGVAMILIVRAMTSSFAADLKVWINAYMGGDLYVSSSVPLRSELARQLGSIDGVEAATPVHYQSVELQLPNNTQENLTYMAVDPATYTRVTSFVFSGDETNAEQALSQLNAGGTVFVSSVLSEKFGYRAGDQIVLKTPSGLRSFDIGGVVVDFYNQGLVITGNWQDMRRYFRANEVSTILIKVQDEQTISNVQSTIDALYGKRYQLSIEANTAVKERIFNLMDQAFIMFDMMAVLAVIVASLGIVNTLTMNVMERTREIGMLRAIGMTQQQVRQMILAEAGLMGIMGGLLGLVFGIFLSRIFLFGMTAMSGYKIDLVIPIAGIITGLIVSLVISQLAALQPAKRAATINILDAIHYE